MSGYKQILAAIDFSEHSDRVIQRAIEMAGDDGVVSLIHVVDYFPMMDAAYDGAFIYSVDITDELLESSKKRLIELGAKYQLSGERLQVEVGEVRKEIIKKSEKMAIDLLVIGSHGWRGIDLLLGSTTDSVLHHARRDVLVVRCN
jgi:universal stress protein A